ncbi:hypothetical protein [Paenibacillus sp. FSL L8-0463]|uniref:hypothetical protein n=1 Tax=Paenibacillus sp. FSL L8-0463 TaxID=2954687 RepID=UPI00311A8A75
MVKNNEAVDNIDLFSFEFENIVTDSLIEGALAEVVATAKSLGNSHSFNINRSKLRLATINLLPELEKRGYLTIWNEGVMCNLADEYREWHDPAEVAADYRQRAYEALASGSTYYDLHDLSYGIPAGPGIQESVHAEKVKIAEALGIEHARQNKGAFGYQINSLPKGRHAAYEAILQVIEETNDWRSISQFFKETLFQTVDRYVEGYRYVLLTPTEYESVCLAQSSTIKDIAWIISYSGFILYSEKYLPPEKTIILWDPNSAEDAHDEEWTDDAEDTEYDEEKDDFAC